MNEFIKLCGLCTVKDVVVVAASISFIFTVIYQLFNNSRQISKRIDEYEKVVDLTYKNAESIEEIACIVKKEQKHSREYQLTSLSDKLFVCYHNCRVQDYITRGQLDNFNRNVKMYKKLGGNSIVDSVYIPYIKKLEVRD